MQPNACAIRKVKDDMTGKGGNGELPLAPQRKERLPSEILDIIKPALQVGGLSGMLKYFLFLSSRLPSDASAPFLHISRDRTLLKQKSNS